MSKKKGDYIDELVEYQNEQFLPHTHYMKDGELPRYLREGDKKPARMAVLFAVSIPAAVFAAVYFGRLFIISGCNDWGSLVTTVVFSAATVLYVMIVINYIKKAQRIKAARAQQRQMRKKRKRRK